MKKTTQQLKKYHSPKVYKIKDKINFIITAILLLEIAFALFRTEWTILFITIITLVLISSVQFFTKKTQSYIYIPEEFQIATVLFIFATLFLGEIHGYYESFWWWDLVLHTGSAVVFGFVGFIILLVLQRGGRVEAKALWLAIFSFAFAMAIGVVWEIFEFTADQLFNLNMQKSGLTDTMWDLIVNALGALFASFVGFLYLKGEDKFSFSVLIDRFIKNNPQFFKE
ncbi:MAG: hypothetical protein KAT32_01910 [Candidatus Moranbacteria bacterium]|nr:hypothetical protein [Candidatus Moranbacteria bacterium]